jgi:ABC-type sugar transport system permease subunit
MSQLVLEDTPPQVAKSQLAGQVKSFPWFLFAPTIIYLFALTVFPLLYSLYISLFRVPMQRDVPWEWVGLSNYGTLLGDPVFWRATFVTFLIAFIAVLVEVVLGVVVAVFLNQKLQGMGLFRLLAYLPMMISPLVLGLFWKFMLDGTFGVVNWMVESFLEGIPNTAFSLATLLQIIAVIALLPLGARLLFWLRRRDDPDIEGSKLQQQIGIFLGVIGGLVLISMILPTINIMLFENGVLGLFNPFVQLFGGEPLAYESVQWTIEPNLAVASIIFVDVWQWTPFVALLATAGLQTVPPQLYEAARLDRASRMMQFRRITLPFLVTPLLIAVLFRSIDTIKIFDTVWLLTGGGPGDFTQTWSVMVYKLGFLFNGRRGEAAALSWIMVIFINIVVTVLLQLVARSRRRSRIVAAQE